MLRVMETRKPLGKKGSLKISPKTTHQEHHFPRNPALYWIMASLATEVTNSHSTRELQA